MKQATKNKYCFGLGTVGRDALYTLVSMYMMTHLTEVVGLSDFYLGIITTLFLIFRIFDSVNDPFMGTIVDNTKTRWGKFKPWILVGMLSTGVLTVLLFNNFIDTSTDEGSMLYVIIFGITYFLWSCAFTVNDMSYWGMMPAISKDLKEREGIGATARFCANIGMFAVVILYTMIPDLFKGLGIGSSRDAYFWFSIIIVALMWGFQLFTLFGVKEDRSALEKQEHTSIRQMFGVLLKNDQLMVAAVSMALFSIGYGITTSFGIYYFKYAYKDEGVYMVFAAVLAVAQLTALSVFHLFRKKYNRKQLYTASMIAVCIAYLLFFFSFEQLPLIIIAGLLLFSAQAFIQLLMLLFVADAVEYGEWKLGKRNESISFAVQPFVNQIGGAVASGVVGFTLIISGINRISQQIAGETDPVKIQELINNTPDSAIWIMKIAMMIVPLFCIVGGFILYKKKFIIDEKMYERICSELEERNK